MHGLLVYEPVTDFCYIIFLGRFEFLNEITIVKRVGKFGVLLWEWGNWSQCQNKKVQIYTLLTSLDICLKLYQGLYKHFFV